MKDNAGIWKVSDKTWMDARKKEWKNVVENLNKLTNLVDKKARKYHKELFFTGKIHEDLISRDPEIYGKMLDMRVFDNYELFFRMWYHPEPSLEIFQEMVKTEKNKYGVEGCRELLFSRIAKDRFLGSYGLAGGVEKLMVLSVVLGFDFNEEYKFESGQKVGKGLHPYYLLGNCPVALFCLLRGIPISPFAPGQYLLDNLNFALEKYPEITKSEERFPMAEKHLRHAMHDMQAFDTSKMEPYQVKAATRLREELLGRFEARDFGATLMGYWDEAKSRYEAGELPPSFT